ncbi:MAG: TlpA disulfide reductase family protein [Bacteroidota bacterium]
MKTITGCILLCLLALNTIAQTGERKRRLDEIEVKDSAGMVYPTVVVQKLLMTGKYTIRLNAASQTGLLVKLTEEEINKRNERLPRPGESRFFKTGEKISSFTERDIRGNKYNLKELLGKVVVLNFWFINCPPCRMEMPDLNELVENYKDNKEVVFIAVALDEKYAIQDFLKTNPFQYNIIDNGRYIASKYGITSYPTHVILDRQGKVNFHTSGLATSTVPWIKKSIEAALKETVPQ